MVSDLTPFPASYIMLGSILLAKSVETPKRLLPRNLAIAPPTLAIATQSSVG